MKLYSPKLNHPVSEYCTGIELGIVWLWKKICCPLKSWLTLWNSIYLPRLNHPVSDNFTGIKLGRVWP